MKTGGSVYILTNHYNTVLYTGVTSDLYSRVSQHRNKAFPNSFSAKYNCNKLVYFEHFGRIEEAIGREKRLKKWNRAWKVALVNELNPEWQDLFETI